MTAHGYVDLQVNGYAGVDFNANDLTAEGLHLACERLRGDGVAGVLATVITEHVPTMCGRIARLVDLRAADPLAASVIAGVHVEGPFIKERARINFPVLVDRVKSVVRVAGRRQP
jgi:N-acetylglucosamine-6-phosphate deacetylase